MSRGSAKKARERKHPPETRETPKKRSALKAVPGPEKKQEKEEAEGPRRQSVPECLQCSANLKENDRALFVEEEVGRVFCSEACIVAYFTPEIERLEEEYRKRLGPRELDEDSRERLAHLRWETLRSPEEVWLEKTLSGDSRYTLIAPYDVEGEIVWSICLSLFLRGEPSFLYLAFVTRDEKLVEAYRRGERLEWEDNTEAEDEEGVHLLQVGVGDTSSTKVDDARMDRLAEPWTAEESLRARLNQERREDDIPLEEFLQYEGCLEPTLEEPDEVWSFRGEEDDALGLFHFLRNCKEHGDDCWFVVVARETDDEEHMEILDAFPTRDTTLVESYRCGRQESGRGVQESMAAENDDATGSSGGGSPVLH